MRGRARRRRHHGRASTSAATAGSAPPSSARATWRSTSATATRRAPRRPPSRAGRDRRRRARRARRAAVATAEELLIRADRARGRARASSSCRRERRRRRRARSRGRGRRDRARRRRRHPRRAGRRGDAPATRRPRRAGARDHDQIEATTVYDRDSRHAPSAGGARRRSRPPACPTTRLDVGGWSNGLPLAAQLPPLRRQLVGEFDAPNAAGGARPRPALHPLRLRRRGRGARSPSFAAAQVEDRALLVDLARAVEGRPARPDGPLAVAGALPRPPRPLAGARRRRRRPSTTRRASPAVQAAFAALPTDLRVLLAPRPRRPAARRRPPGRGAADLRHRRPPRRARRRRARPRRGAARRAPRDSRSRRRRRSTALIETGGHTSVEALTDLVRLALDAGLPVPDRVVTDLRAAALQYRGARREAGAARAPRRGAGAAAPSCPRRSRETRAAMRDLPARRPGFDALGGRGCSPAADPAAVGAAAYAETVARRRRPGRRASPPTTRPRRPSPPGSSTLGLPDAGARDWSPRPLGRRRRGGAPARRPRPSCGSARAPEAARRRSARSTGAEAAELRARAFALAGAYGEALATLADRGMAAAAAPYAWPSGDWPRARAAAADDPARLAMAAYMTVSAGAAAAPAPSPDPAALAPEARVPGAAAAARPAEPRRRPPAARHRRQGRRLRRGRARSAVGAGGSARVEQAQQPPLLAHVLRPRQRRHQLLERGEVVAGAEGCRRAAASRGCRGRAA